VNKEAVRAVFTKHYSGGELKEALILSTEEISLVILGEVVGSQEALPDIVGVVIKGRSRIDLFKSMFAMDQVNPIVPMSYILYFDQIRKSMLDTVKYMRDNYETVQPWFRERFTKESLEIVLASLSSQVIESAPKEMFDNVRGLNLIELQLEQEFFTMALIGLLGIELFKKYADEYNQHVIVLIQCQNECEILEKMASTGVSRAS